MLKQMFLAHFEPVVTHFEPLKSQNALKSGSLGSKNGCKMGQKRIFPKGIVDHWGYTNKCFEPSLSPF